MSSAFDHAMLFRFLNDHNEKKSTRKLYIY